MDEKTIPTLSDLERSYGALANLSKDEAMPFKLKYRVGKMLRRVESEVKQFQNMRLDIVKKHGKQDPEDGQYKVGAKDCGLEAYNAAALELEDLSKVESTMTIDQFPASMLEYESAKFTAADLAPLWWLITD